MSDGRSKEAEEKEQEQAEIVNNSRREWRRIKYNINSKRCH